MHRPRHYEPNQFFRAHQDSEKDDSMIGTLVVTLPSSPTGGALMVGLGEEWKANRRLQYFPDPDADGTAPNRRRSPRWKQSTVGRGD
jgi:hypothetical protein